MRKLAGSTVRGVTAGVALRLTTVDCFSLFQSFATYHDRRNPPLNVKEWRHQAKRRAFGLPDSRLTEINCDEDGDEIYHDA